jgi:hypothetical protein
MNENLDRLEQKYACEVRKRGQSQMDFNKGDNTMVDFEGSSLT